MSSNERSTPLLSQGWQIHADPMQLPVGFSFSFTSIKWGSYIIQQYCTEKHLHVINTCQSHSALSMWVNLSSSNYEFIIAIRHAAFHSQFKPVNTESIMDFPSIGHRLKLRITHLVFTRNLSREWANEQNETIKLHLYPGVAIFSLWATLKQDFIKDPFKREFVKGQIDWM